MRLQNMSSTSGLAPFLSTTLASSDDVLTRRRCHRPCRQPNIDPSLPAPPTYALFVQQGCLQPVRVRPVQHAIPDLQLVASPIQGKEQVLCPMDTARCRGDGGGGAQPVSRGGGNVERASKARRSVGIKMYVRIGFVLPCRGEKVATRTSGRRPHNHRRRTPR